MATQANVKTSYATRRDAIAAECAWYVQGLLWQNMEDDAKRAHEGRSHWRTLAARIISTLAKTLGEPDGGSAF